MALKRGKKKVNKKISKIFLFSLFRNEEKWIVFFVRVQRWILKLENNRNKHFLDTPSGALIMTATKELCAQIYSVIRNLDEKNEINISRTGSIGYVAPIVQFLVLYILYFFFHFFS